MGIAQLICSFTIAILLNLTVQQKNIKLAILRPKPDDQNIFNPKSKMGAGAIVAIDKVNNHQPLVDGYRLVPTWYQPGCNDLASLNAVVNASFDG
ncbi:hypothetical protein ACHWQZ_G002514 [Mnemiopsis leidyi]